jgi:hypothetical protein
MLLFILRIACVCYICRSNCILYVEVLLFIMLGLVYKSRLLCFMSQCFPSSGTLGAGAVDPHISAIGDKV